MDNPALSAQVGKTAVRLEHSPDCDVVRIHVTDDDVESAENVAGWIANRLVENLHNHPAVVAAREADERALLHGDPDSPEPKGILNMGRS